VFDKMHFKDIVSWNVLIIAYVHNGYDEESLMFFFSK
jgi:pentatricopeptide repeat protein